MVGAGAYGTVTGAERGGAGGDHYFIFMMQSMEATWQIPNWTLITSALSGWGGGLGGGVSVGESWGISVERSSCAPSFRVFRSQA